MINSRFSALTQLSYDELLEERERVLLELIECLQHGISSRDTYPYPYLEEYFNTLEDLIDIRAQAVNYEE